MHYDLPCYCPKIFFIMFFASPNKEVFLCCKLINLKLYITMGKTDFHAPCIYIFGNTKKKLNQRLGNSLLPLYKQMSCYKYINLAPVYSS